jgi:hypothetical protein
MESLEPPINYHKKELDGVFRKVGVEQQKFLNIVSSEEFNRLTEKRKADCKGGIRK